jgi:hypothetical protein
MIIIAVTPWITLTFGASLATNQPVKLGHRSGRFIPPVPPR